MAPTLRLSEAARKSGLTKDVITHLGNTGYIGTRLVPGMRERRYLAEDVAKLAEAGWSPATQPITPDAPSAQAVAQ